MEDTQWNQKKRLVTIAAVLILLIAGLLIILFARGGAKDAREQQAAGVEGAIPRRTVDQIPNDRDYDGLSNEEEAAAGTSEIEFDTDRDGLSDIDEIRVWKTDPLKRDTDGDGFGDGKEVVGGFNPLGPGSLQQ